MSVKFSNNAKTTLSSSIASSATSIAVADASVFPSISGSEYFYVTFEDLSGNVEIVKVTGVSSNTLTVTRGQESTTARSFSSGDKAENRLTAGGLNDVATQADTDTNTTYSAGSGLSLSGTTFSNTAPDQTVSLSGSGATSVSGTYPNFTVSSTDTNTTYSVGDGGLTQNNFTTTLKNKLDGIEASADVTDTANVVSALTAGSNVTIASDGTISSTDTNTDTTYSAGSGISLSGTTFSNSAPDQTVSLTGSGATSISGTYPNFTITSTDTNTTYTVGDGGLTQNNFTNALKSKLDGIEASADVTDTANVVAALTAGSNVTIASDGTISSSNASSVTVNTYTANGSTSAFTLSTTPSSEDNLIVFVEGVYMNPNDFTLNGTTLTLDAAPPSGRKIVVYQITSAIEVVSGNALNHDQFSCNGSTTAFTLSVDPLSENNTQIFLDGVYQQKTDYSVSGTTLTMDTAPASGATLEVMTFLDTAQAVVADESVTTAKIADQGTDGQVLTSTGSGVAWEDAGGGAWTAISTTTVTSAVSSIEFTLSGYEDYAFRFSRLKPSGGSGSFGRWSFSTNGGSSYSSNIIQAESRVLGSTGSDSDAGSSGSYVQTMDAATTWGHEEGIMYLYGNESGNTVKLGHYTTIAYYDSYMVHEDGGFSIAENSAINKVKIIMSGQNIGSGEVTMYGISRS